MPPPQPSARAIVGITLIVALILILAVLVAAIAPSVENWPVLVQGAFYLVMGIAWIAPLKPLIRWIETGRWRRPSEPGN